MKKKFLIISIVFSLITIPFIFMNFRTKQNFNFIKDKSYSYLSKSAKKYVENVYKETGEIILTEKNKKENVPYLNPEYEEYLNMSDNEKEKVNLVPEPYVIDYVKADNYSQNNNLPKKYDLRNINGNNYITPIKNQGSLGICWAFSTIENAETYIMLKNNQSYNENSEIFSVRQLDYATSSNGLLGEKIENTQYLYSNPKNASRKIGSSGNFTTATVAMANALSLVHEDVLPWNEKTNGRSTNEILNYDNSKYEVDSTIEIPKLNNDATEEEINSYISNVKSYMMQYGAPFVGTYAPNSNCAFKNSDNNYVIKTDECINNISKDAHAMQIVGWDDEYEYSYCDDGETHYASSNNTCSKGTYTQGEGAWILRNSWGNEYEYVYLTYNSFQNQISFITSLSQMSNRNWDNNYYENLWKDNSGMYIVQYQEESFNTHNDNSEKIQKIKFLTSSIDGIYKLSVITKSKTYNDVAYAYTDEPGIYTFDLSNKNIILNDSDFTIKIQASETSKFVQDSISVFTSNINKEPSSTSKFYGSAKTYDEDENAKASLDNPLFVEGKDKTSKMIVEHYLKNIPINANFTYKVLLNQEDYTNYFFSNTLPSSYSFNDYVHISFYPRDTEYSDKKVCGKTLTFQIIYNNQIIESFPLKRICNSSDGKTQYTKSTLRFHKNDGSNYYSSITISDLSNYQLLNSNGTGRDYFGDEEKFFIDDKYIKSWNTKADGTGTSYTTNNLLIYRDMDLYAQWDSPHWYNVVYTCNRYDCNENTYLSTTKRFSYNEELTIMNNSYNNIENQQFLYWENGNDIYYEEEKLKNLVGKKSPFNNDSAYLYAVWSDDYKTISFDANGGTGNMKEINVATSTDSRLKYNLFTYPGYTFTEWNTKKDGTGTTYSDGQVINTNSDITLYAQWQEKEYIITYKSNNGTNETKIQNIKENTLTNLIKNTFEKEGYTFIGWNTKENGTGISYTDEQIVNIDNDLTLYAQWLINTYKITFDANGGTGQMDSINALYNVSTKITKNTFVKTGYTFAGWNTADNGEGTSYSDEQMVNLKDNLILYAQWQEKNISIHANKDSIDFGESYINYDKNISKTITLTNDGDYSVKLSITNPVSDGPFISLGFSNNYLLEPNKSYTITLAAGTGRIFSDTPGTYNGNYVITAKTLDNEKSFDLSIPAKLVLKKRPVDISYTTHVQNIGWQSYVKNGAMAGTSGKALRLEGIKIKLLNKESNDHIEYRTHIQNIGWESSYKKDDEMSGTSGRSYRLEAIQIKLTGNVKEEYDVYYRVHAENFGWLGWAKNDEMAGTAGYAYRLEGIEIKLVKKGETFSEYDSSKVAFKDKNAVSEVKLNKTNLSIEAGEEETLSATINPSTATDKTLTWTSDNESVVTVDQKGKITAASEGTATITVTSKNGKKATANVNVLAPIPGVAYTTHVQYVGWQNYVKNGAMAGTSGKALRLEGIKIKLKNMPYEGDIEYKTHVQNIGWQNYVKNNEMSGTEGMAYRLEAIQIRLTGELAQHYDVYYRVHAENFGWLGWAKNDEQSGTAGYAYRLEGIEIQLVEKGEQPIENSNQNSNKSFYEKK